jgi:hypothetical protein
MHLQPGLKDISDDDEQLEAFNRLVVDELAPQETVEIAAVVTADYVFDFVVLYQSLVESWTFTPFRLHAFTSQRDAYDRIAALELPGVEAHPPAAPDSEDWWDVTRVKATLVEHAGLERCIVSDVDNVFVAETPELWSLLDRYHFVFAGGPSRRWPVQTSLFSFRHAPEALAFAREWERLSEGTKFSDMSGLPYALVESRADVRVKVLLGPTRLPRATTVYYSPYDLQANARFTALRSDALGFSEPRLGRVKVIHLCTLRAEGNESVEARLSTVIARFPGLAPFFPHYLRLVNRAAAALGMETIDDEAGALREQLAHGGVLAERRALPRVLNARGLTGSGVVAGEPETAFINALHQQWSGSDLLSVDASAVDRIEDASVDFVYLVAPEPNDIKPWLAKVRPGGVLAGDDRAVGRGPAGDEWLRVLDRRLGGSGLAPSFTFLDHDERERAWWVAVPLD